MTSLQKAVDKAVRAENRRAVLDSQYEEHTALASALPRYPAGTPEYEAYRARLREELAKWVAGVGEYSQEAADA